MSPDRHKNLNDEIGSEIRKVEPEEINLWQNYTKSIVPKNKRLNSPDGIMGQQQYLKRSNSEKVKSTQLDVSNEYLTHGHYPGFGRKNINRLRRGKIRFDRRLDLHGMTQLEAYKAIVDFIEKAFLNRLNMVLIITGKGFNIKAGWGVLNKGVPKWLNEKPLRLWIKGFGYAAQEHGGEGALYVLIRRRR